MFGPPRRMILGQDGGPCYAVSLRQAKRCNPSVDMPEGAARAGGGKGRWGTGTQIFKRLWSHKLFVSVFTLVFTAVFAFFWLYESIYSCAVRVSFVYPGTEKGLYPDGKRFMMYDLLDKDVVNAALDRIQELGFYTAYDADDMLENLRIDDFLSNPVQEKIVSSRMSGEKYTYYSNEYVFTFTQPMSIRKAGLGGIVAKDMSAQFVTALCEENKRKLIEMHAESVDAFERLASEMDFDESYDYLELAELYQSRINLILQYLNQKNMQDAAYVSPNTGMSFLDLITAFQSLQSVEAQRLSNYVVSSRITRNYDQLVNLYHCDIEDGELTFHKKDSEHEITKQAMSEYDHTFTENLVIVSVNYENGLYQSRPKTAYDTITQQSVNAGAVATSTENTVALQKLRLSDYTSVMMQPGLVNTLTKTAEGLAKNLAAGYDRLCETAAQTVADYLDYASEGYLRIIDVDDSVISLGLIVKTGAAFCLGLVLSCLIAILFLREKEDQGHGRDGGQPAGRPTGPPAGQARDEQT